MLAISEEFADHRVLLMYYSKVRSVVSQGQWPENISEDHYLLRKLYQSAFVRRLWYAGRKIQRAFRKHLMDKRMKMIQQVLVPIIVRNK